MTDNTLPDFEVEDLKTLADMLSLIADEWSKRRAKSRGFFLFTMLTTLIKMFILEAEGGRGAVWLLDKIQRHPDFMAMYPDEVKKMLEEEHE